MSRAVQIILTLIKAHEPLLQVPRLVAHVAQESYGFVKIRNLPGNLTWNSSKSNVMIALAIGDFTRLMGQRNSVGSVFPFQYA